MEIQLHYRPMFTSIIFLLNSTTLLALNKRSIKLLNLWCTLTAVCSTSNCRLFQFNTMNWLILIFFRFSFFFLLCAQRQEYSSLFTVSNVIVIDLKCNFFLCASLSLISTRLLNSSYFVSCFYTFGSTRISHLYNSK